LLERGQLHVEVDLRQVEVGRERLDDLAVGVPGDGKDVWFVSPCDTVEVEDPRQLCIARVSEVRWRVRGHAIRHQTSIVASARGLDLIGFEYIRAGYPQVRPMSAFRG
jgi:hypothetical protein